MEDEGSMEISKAFIQAIIVITWGIYVFFHVWSDLQGVTIENPRPMA